MFAGHNNGIMFFLELIEPDSTDQSGAIERDPTL